MNPSDGLHPFTPEQLVLRALADRITEQQLAGQFRRDGTTPATVHAARVSIRVSQRYVKMTPEELFHRKMVAKLHDVLEDGDGDPVALLDQGIPRAIVDDLIIMTWKPGEDYLLDYLPRVACNPRTRDVKICDVLDNIGDDPTNRQIRKYAVALTMLMAT